MLSRRVIQFYKPVAQIINEGYFFTRTNLIFGLMKFAYPGFLFALFTLALPIFLHFYNLRKYKRLYFSNLQFVKQLDQESKSTKKLKHLLVLIARCLAITLLVLGFAQPFIPNTATSKNGANVLAIYVDNSFSMTLKGTDGELLSEAKEAAKKIIKKSPNNTRYLITTNALSGSENQLCNATDALERIDNIKTSALTRNSETILNWQRERLNSIDTQLEKIGQRSYIFLSDFQKSTAKMDALEKDENASYYPIQIVAQNKQNVYIDSVWFASPFRKAGTVNKLFIRVKQTILSPINTEVNVKIGDINRSLFVEFTNKNEAIATLSYTEQSEGWKNGCVKVQDSEITFDDSYYFSYEVKKHIDLVVLNGESAQESIPLVYSLDTYFTTQVIPEGSFSPDALNGKNVIVLNGLNSISSGLAEQLVAFSKKGGSVLLFPGENIDFSSWNACLSKLGLPQLGGIQNAATKIKSIAYDDPFFENVFEKKPTQLNLPAFSKTYTIAKNTNAKPLIFLQNGAALFAASLGARKNYLFGAALTPSFGTFVSDALYSTLLIHVAELSQNSKALSFTVGEENTYPLPLLANPEEAIHLKNETIDFIPERMEIDGKTIFSLANDNALEALSPGVFTLAGSNKIAEIALNYNRAESNCESYSTAEIENLFELRGIKNVKLNTLVSGANLLEINLSTTKEYWRLCLFLALLFLLIEMALIKFIK